MGIVEDDIGRVRAATSLVAVAQEHVALRKVGRRWQGLCPFHAEKTPSFSVNEEEGLYYCFGCQAKGDVITFIRDVEHLEFAEAVERLAAKAGIQVRYDSQRATQDRKRRSQLVEALDQAVDWYHDRLLTAADAAHARSYLRSRGYDGEVVRAYRLGWAPDDWDALVRALRLPDDVLCAAGLAFRNRRGRLQDSFRGRVMFPIFRADGEAVAFGGRILPGGEGPKYKNSPETAVYSKSRVLYGLNWAKSAVVEAGEVVVCEGYTDVIGLARAGMGRAVATCGTALADEHLRLLKNFARRVVLAYDADSAGQAAAERFYEWEQRYELDIAVADLPPGSDPADVARTDPDRLRDAVEHARSFLGFRVERVLSGSDLRTPEGRARAAEEAVAVVREHPSDLVRDQYVMAVADRCRIDPDRLRARLRAPAGHPPPPVRAKGPEAEGPELEALKVAVHRPEEVAGHLHEVLFADEVNRAAFVALAGADTLREAIDGAPPEAAALLQRLAVEESDAEPATVVGRLAELAADRVVSELEAEARHADDISDDATKIAFLKLAVEDIREPRATLDASDRLVRWLIGRVEVEA